MDITRPTAQTGRREGCQHLAYLALDCAQNGVNEHEFEQSRASVYKM